MRALAALALSVLALTVAPERLTASGTTGDRAIEIGKGASPEGCFLRVLPDGFRFEIVHRDERVLVAAHPTAGLLINGQPASVTGSGPDGKLEVRTENTRADVTVWMDGGVACIAVNPAGAGIQTITLQTGGMSPAFGLGDSGSYGPGLNLVRTPATTYRMINDGEQKRWISTFAIFPRHRAAGVIFDEGEKTVTLGPDVYGMTIKKEGGATFRYFAGSIEQIYSAYLAARNSAGYPDLAPKIRLFELGWESWDALGWNSNSGTVKTFLQRYLDEGYPIRWAVTGSGFWVPGGTTTSFGEFGPSFADHREFKAWLNKHNIHWMIGQRTNFVPSGGPFIPATAKRNENQKTNEYLGNPLSDIGLAKGYFVLDEKGQPLMLTSDIFPQVPCFLLDGRKPEASRWFADEYKKWGVDGIKEDTMMRLGNRIEIFNGPMAEIDRDGALVMARCGSYSAPGTLLRVNDTSGAVNMSHRTPVNYLQYAASAAPNVYSDTVGFRSMNNVSTTMRHAWLCSLTAGMALGAYPEKWTPDQKAVFRKAVTFHYQLVPYLYDAAVKSHLTGFPFTLTPLGIAYPDDPSAAEPPHFQWMVGESLLAAPLLKNHQAGKITIYLPEGIWFDYDTGERFEGPKVLENLSMPIDKTPCFVGGKGVLVLREADDKPLEAAVYPVLKTEVRFTFHHPDGKTSELSVQPWSGTPKVMDTTDGRAVPVTPDPRTGAVRFPLIPGHRYSLAGS